MVKDMFCDSCKKNSVCKNLDILMKFDETAKKQLGIDITMTNARILMRKN